jgi:transcriptional regulator with XRE-family HTH domain
LELSQKIIAARKAKGLTQEELAELANTTVRTIQRIENAENKPRPYTIKSLAIALETSYEELIGTTKAPTTYSSENMEKVDSGNEKHALQLICLSCFSYLIVPFVHFLIPSHLLKKAKPQNQVLLDFARTMIRTQLYWKISLWLILLATLGYNFIRAVYFDKTGIVNYLWPFFILYALNAGIIFFNLWRLKGLCRPIVG